MNTQVIKAKKPKMGIHYDTLGLLLSDIEVQYDIIVPLVTGGIKYEETMRLELDIGHAKKKLHVQIYRLQSGRYEYNGYVL